MAINAHGRTWKVVDPILLAGSRNYRKLFSWCSFSRVAETVMSKPTRYFFWYLLGREVWARSRRKTPEMLGTWKQKSSEGSQDIRSDGRIQVRISSESDETRHDSAVFYWDSCRNPAVGNRSQGIRQLLGWIGSKVFAPDRIWPSRFHLGSYDWIFPPSTTARNLAKLAVEYDQWIPASKFPAISGEFWPKT